MAVVYRHRVRYHEADCQGYMFNGRFLELADVGMVEFFRELGWDYARLNDTGVDPSVAHASLDFISPGVFDDELDLDVECSRVGTSSFDLDTVVRRRSDVVARIHIVYVNVDTAVNRSRPLPEPLASVLMERAARPALAVSEDDL